MKKEITLNVDKRWVENTVSFGNELYDRLSSRGVTCPERPSLSDYTTKVFEITNPITNKVIERIEMSESDYRKLSLDKRKQLEPFLVESDDSKFKTELEKWNKEVKEFTKERDKEKDKLIEESSIEEALTGKIIDVIKYHMDTEEDIIIDLEEDLVNLFKRIS